MSGWSLVSNRSSRWGWSPAWKGPSSQPSPRPKVSPDPNGKNSRTVPSLDCLGRAKEPRGFAVRGDSDGAQQSSDGESVHSRNDIDPARAEEGIASSREPCQVSGSSLADTERGLNGVNGISMNINGDPSTRVILNSKWEQDDPRNWWNKLVAEDVEAVSNYRKSSVGEMSPQVLGSLIKQWIQDKRTVALSDGDGFADLEPTRPIWVGVYQEPSEDVAALYATGFPIVEESLSNFILQGTPQATLRGCTFENFDVKFGNWRNFFIGVKGSVCGLEEHVFWPNWLYHNSRRMMNCRDWNDLGEFLADPTKERIVLHLENAKRFQEDRGYHKGWSYYRLRDRWGQECLKRYGIDL